MSDRSPVSHRSSSPRPSSRITDTDCQAPPRVEPLEPRTLFSGSGFEFPEGVSTGGVINVVTEYGANTTDDAAHASTDTTALQDALDDATGARIIYLPDGVYNIDASLLWDAGFANRVTLQGQSRDGTVIKLVNSDADFATGEVPLIDMVPIVVDGKTPAQNFHYEIRDLTVDTGTGNPAAIGIDFVTNNQGGIKNVKVISQDGQGVAGIQANAGEFGPALFSDIEVEGFDFGLRVGLPENSLTVENLTLTDQNVAGVFNLQQILTIRNLTSTQSGVLSGVTNGLLTNGQGVPAILNGVSTNDDQSRFGVVTVIDADLTYTGTAAVSNAIRSGGQESLRDISVTGYSRSLLSNQIKFQPNTVGDNVEGGDITEYTTASPDYAANELFSSTGDALDLTIKETPVVSWDDPADWVNVADFADEWDGNPATTSDNDVTADIQAAIDSMKSGGSNFGKTTLYFPGDMRFNVEGLVEVSGPVKRLIGLKGRVTGEGGQGGFKVVDGTSDAPTVIFERFNSAPGGANRMKIVHDTTRTVVLSSMSNVTVDSTGTGDLFFEDVVGGPFNFLNPDQDIFARQLDSEVQVDPAKILNEGADLWILGLKTEKAETVVQTTNGGRTEIIGGVSNRANRVDDQPMFVNIDSEMSINGFAEYPGADGFVYDTLIEETRFGETRVLRADDVVASRTNNGRIILGYSSEATTGNRLLPAGATASSTANTLRDSPGFAVWGRGLEDGALENYRSAGWSTASGQLGSNDVTYEIDLGKSTVLSATDTLKIWNYNWAGQTARGVKEVSFDVSTDGVNYTAVSGAVIKNSGGVTVSNLTQAPGTDGYNTPDTVSFGSELTARYVRLTIPQGIGTGNHGDTQGRAGLGEVQVFGALDVTSDLEALYRFQESVGSPSTVYDTSGNDVDGTAGGNPRFVDGPLGNALDFNGDDDIVTLGTPDLTGSELTLAGLVYLQDSDDARIISKSSSITASSHYWTLGVVKGEVRFRIKADDGSGGTNDLDFKTTTADLELREWTHIAGTWDGTTARVYVNGVLVESTAFSGTAIKTDNTVPAAIGNQPNSANRGLNGLIDDVAVYTRALSADEIKLLIADAPLVGQDTYQVIKDTGSLTTTAVSGVLSNDIDLDTVGTLTASLVNDVQNGTLTLNSDGSFTYTPNSGFEGTDTFTYRVSDGTDSSISTVNINVINITDSVVSNWAFDETSGTTASDSSGNGNSGTLANGASFVTGLTGNAVDFGGGDDVVTLGNLDVDDGSGGSAAGIAIAGFAKFDGFSGGASGVRIISKSSSSALDDHYWMLGVTGSGDVKFRVRGDLGSGDSDVYELKADVADRLSTGEWYHLAATWDGSTAKIYVDGVLVKEGDFVANGVPVDNTVPAAIGNDPNTQTHGMDGQVDDLRLYRRALTASEVLGLAVPVITGVSVDAYSSQFDAGFSTVGEAINGSGVNSAIGTHTTDENDLWVSGTGGAQGIDDPTPQVDIDLGATYNLSSMQFWNYNGIFQGSANTDRGAATLDIYVSEDADGDDIPDGYTLLKTVNPAEAPATADYTGEVYGLDDAVARFVRLDITASHGSTDFGGFSDVQFRGNLNAAAAGDAIDTVSVLDFSSQFNPTLNVVNSINGSGIQTVTNFHDNDETNTWLAGSNANPDATPEVEYDLGGTYDLTSFRFWNYAGKSSGTANETDRGAEEIKVYVSADTNNDDLPDGYTLVSTIAPQQATDDGGYVGEVFSLLGQTGRFVKLDVTDNYGAANFGGFSEVEFRGQLVSLPTGSAVTTASVYDYSTQFSTTLNVANTIDGSGIDPATNFHDNDETNTWLAGENGAGTLDPTPEVEYDLGGTYDLTSFRFWNYNGKSGTTDETGRGAEEIKVYVSADANDDDVPDGYTLVSTIAPERAPGNDGYLGEVFSLAGETGRFVKLDVTDNFSGNRFGGFSEVQFRGQLVSLASGSAITGVTVDAVSSEFSTALEAENTINGSGLDSETNTHSNSDPDTWLSGAADPLPQIDYDLGDTYDLTSLRLWNYNVLFGSTDLSRRGAEEIDIYVSLDANDDGVADGYTLLTTINPLQAPADDDYTGEVFGLNGLTGATARFIRLDFTDNYGDVLYGGLSEVVFHGELST